LKRWIALMLGIIALAAGFVQLRRMAQERDVAAPESISAQSRAQLDDVVRKSTAP